MTSYNKKSWDKRDFTPYKEVYFRKEKKHRDSRHVETTFRVSHHPAFINRIKLQSNHRHRQTDVSSDRDRYGIRKIQCRSCMVLQAICRHIAVPQYRYDMTQHDVKRHFVHDVHRSASRLFSLIILCRFTWYHVILCLVLLRYKSVAVRYLYDFQNVRANVL